MKRGHKEITQNDVKKADEKIKREIRVPAVFIGLALFQIGLIINYGLNVLPITVCIALMILPIMLIIYYFKKLV